MEISKDIYMFFTILECDMNTKIAAHIKNSLSFNGFGIALSFKDLTNDDIDAVVEYVREELPILLDAALTENELVYDHKQKMCFFGPYASAPDKFKMPLGDRKTLLALVDYVKEIVDQPTVNTGLVHFSNGAVISKKELSYEQNMVRRVFGLVFGCAEENRRVQTADNIPKMHNELFIKAKDIFDKFENEEEGIVLFQSFTPDMVNVTLVEQKPKGTVQCVFCNQHDLSSNVKVFWKTNCWALANLNAHMKRKHQKTAGESRELLKLDIEILPLNPNCEEKAADSSTSLDSIDSCEDAIYSQISAQCIRMANVAAKNKEKTQSSHFGNRSVASRKTQAVNYCTIRPNGNCFFSSIVHQLFDIPNGTRDFENEAQKLRTETVDYIKQSTNLPSFVHDLKNRINYSNSDDDTKIKNACVEFLDEKLSVPGVWAGMESLKAISEMKNVNIIVINDDGTSHLPNRFNPKADKSILLLFSAKGGKSSQDNQTRNHYDSVIRIGNARIAKMAKDISEVELRREQFAKENADHSLIEIS